MLLLWIKTGLSCIILAAIMMPVTWEQVRDTSPDWQVLCSGIALKRFFKASVLRFAILCEEVCCRKVTHLCWTKILRKVVMNYLYLDKNLSLVFSMSIFHNLSVLFPNNWLPSQSNMSRLYLLKRYNKPKCQWSNIECNPIAAVRISASNLD